MPDPAPGVLVPILPHADAIEYDLTCLHCSYNLRGLSVEQVCPECGESIRRRLSAALDRTRSSAQTTYSAWGKTLGTMGEPLGFAPDAMLFICDALTYRLFCANGESTILLGANTEFPPEADFCAAVRDFALLTFGARARLVLEAWGLRSGADLGRILKALDRRGYVPSQGIDFERSYAGMFTLAGFFPPLRLPPHPPAITIRQPVAADYEEWLRLRRELWPERPRGQHPREMDGYVADGRTGSVFFAQTGQGRLVGFIEAAARKRLPGHGGRQVGCVDGWFVEPEQRRRGTGRQLLAAAEAWAGAQGCREMLSEWAAESSVGAAVHAGLGYDIQERVTRFHRALSPATPAAPASAQADIQADIQADPGAQPHSEVATDWEPDSVDFEPSKDEPPDAVPAARLNVRWRPLWIVLIVLAAGWLASSGPPGADGGSMWPLLLALIGMATPLIARVTRYTMIVGLLLMVVAILDMRATAGTVQVHEALGVVLLCAAFLALIADLMPVRQEEGAGATQNTGQARGR